MNVDTTVIRKKAKNLNKTRTKRLTNSLCKWSTSLGTGQLEFQQFQSYWKKDPSLSSIIVYLSASFSNSFHYSTLTYQ